MENQVNCSICTAEMVLDKRLGNHNNVTRYRYNCIVCNHSEVRYTKNKRTESESYQEVTEQEVLTMYRNQLKNN